MDDNNTQPTTNGNNSHENAVASGASTRMFPTSALLVSQRDRNAKKKDSPAATLGPLKGSAGAGKKVVERQGHQSKGGGQDGEEEEDAVLRRSGGVRSLAEITGEPDILAMLHRHFVWILRAGVERVAEHVLSGPPLEEDLKRAELLQRPPVSRSKVAGVGAVGGSSAPASGAGLVGDGGFYLPVSGSVEDSLASPLYREVVDEEYRHLALLRQLWNNSVDHRQPPGQQGQASLLVPLRVAPRLLTGRPVVVKASDPAALTSVVLALERLLPLGCRSSTLPCSAGWQPGYRLQGVLQFPRIQQQSTSTSSVQHNLPQLDQTTSSANSTSLSRAASHKNPNSGGDLAKRDQRTDESSAGKAPAKIDELLDFDLDCDAIPASVLVLKLQSLHACRCRACDPLEDGVSSNRERSGGLCGASGERTPSADDFGSIDFCLAIDNEQPQDPTSSFQRSHTSTGHNLPYSGVHGSCKYDPSSHPNALENKKYPSSADPNQQSGPGHFPPNAISPTSLVLSPSSGAGGGGLFRPGSPPPAALLPRTVLRLMDLLGSPVCSERVLASGLRALHEEWMHKASMLLAYSSQGRPTYCRGGGRTAEGGGAAPHGWGIPGGGVPDPSGAGSSNLPQGTRDFLRAIRASEADLDVLQFFTQGLSQATVAAVTKIGTESGGSALGSGSAPVATVVEP